MGARIAMGVVAAVAAFSVTAFADGGVSIEGRMFLRDKGTLDEDVFSQGDASQSNLDYGVLADEMLLTVVVPEAAAPGGGKLTVTVQQGKRTLAKRVWDVRVGEAYGIPVAHFPVLVEPVKCGAPLVVTAKLGSATTTRTLRFTCAE